MPACKVKFQYRYGAIDPILVWFCREKEGQSKVWGPYPPNFQRGLLCLLGLGYHSHQVPGLPVLFIYMKHSREKFFYTWGRRLVVCHARRPSNLVPIVHLMRYAPGGVMVMYVCVCVCCMQGRGFAHVTTTQHNIHYNPRRHCIVTLSNLQRIMIMGAFSRASVEPVWQASTSTPLLPTVYS
jgi:hypothetical protein